MTFQVAQSLGIEKLDLFLIVLQATFANPHGKSFLFFLNKSVALILGLTNVVNC